ncbi:MAG: hypothetical protein KBA96_10250 [Rhodocyclaceae bacterium]|nr:hypothetical protein [Rhodocyclaceae bacterium]
MKCLSPIVRSLLASVFFVGMLNSASAQSPADPWPRQVQLDGATATIYQPEVDAWDGNQIQVRGAVSIKATGSEVVSFGSVSATARTEVDRSARTVTIQDVAITKSNFPTLGTQGTAYAQDLQMKLGQKPQVLSLDRIQASLKATGVKAPSFQVKNDPPKIIISISPAILVPIDGPAAIKPVLDDSRFSRVINTRALILQGGLGGNFFLHVYDGWLSASTLDGPWTKAGWVPIGMDDVAQKIAASGVVDMLTGGPTANPKPTLDKSVPTIYVSHVPTELIVFQGQPSYVSAGGTLFWAVNTGADVFVESVTNDYYVLLSGRWFTATSTNGPWTFVPSNALPPDFSRIPLDSPAAVVLASVAGTPQAQEAVIANSIPQTATIPLTNGPNFSPSFDGPPQFQTIEGTPLSRTTNSSVPIIQVDANNFFAVNSGVWFVATAVGGPYRIATAVPAVIYTIPPSSSVHYVTYVRVYGSTPQVAYVGYTPGYMGTVVGPYGTVVYGTGYYYTPWVGSVWYAPPYTYSIAAVPVYSMALGFSYGYATGLATAAWVTPYYGAAYHPYACCGSVSTSVYGQYGHTAYSGTATAYASSTGAVGVAGSGSYYNKATGTSGDYASNRSYNPYTGVAKESGAVTGTTAAGGSGSAAAGRSYDAYTGQHAAGSSFSGTSADGSSIEHSGATTWGPQGYSHTGSTSTYNASTGESKSWGGGDAPSGSRSSGFSGGGGGFSRGGGGRR